jgi:hypothetical protein
MHLRVSTVKKAGRTYRYTQLVQSIRRSSDGMPTTQVIAHLGKLSQIEIDNLRLALKASRQGQTLVLPSPARAPSGQPVTHNLRYLDVAVALEAWRSWELEALLDDLDPTNKQTVPFSRIVAALTIQRCIDPGSKLFAERWFPRTALPELLDITPSQFNNTRLHRALSTLDQITPQLQQQLPLRYQARDGLFSTFFVDLTDTWFVGQGPDAAQKRKTKEGLYRRKVGILLMCNPQGYPLRWEMLPGRQTDSSAIQELVEALDNVSWIGNSPIICDRAMGKTAYLQRLLQTGKRFLTAMNVNEFDAYTNQIPHTALSEVSVFTDDALKQLGEAAEKAGMSKLSDDLYVLDLGVVSHRSDESEAVFDPPKNGEDKTVQALRLARQMQAEIDAGQAANAREAGKLHGLLKNRANTLLCLLRLDVELQEQVLMGGAPGISIKALLRVVKHLEPQAQRQAFVAECAAAAQRRVRSPARTTRKNPAPNQGEKSSVRLRAVVTFNPEVRVNQGKRADELLANIHRWLQELNAALANPRSHRGKESIYAEVYGKLKRRDLVEVFSIAINRVELEPDTKPRWQISIQLNEGVWQQRRRYDGFSLLVAHPGLLHEASELARLYRAKDAVEKDFQLIKSVIKLRPVRHRTDPKVRAHITLCMLALLLERTIEAQLAKRVKNPMTAPTALELLSNIHLNRLQPEGATEVAYSVTQLGSDQHALLQVLGLEHLAEDNEIASQITPR